jgi:hypothetical protein
VVVPGNHTNRRSGLFVTVPGWCACKNGKVNASGPTRAPLSRVILFVFLLAVPVAVMVASVASGYLIGDLPIDVVGLLAYGGLGGIVIFRRDGHAVGWLLLGVGAAVISVSRLEGFPGLSPELADWVGSAGWPIVFGLFAALTLVFPSGHLPRGDNRMARIGRLAGRWLLPLAVVLSALTSGPFEEMGSSPAGLLPGWLWFPAYAILVLILVGGAVSLVVRRRHSTGVERAQIGWVVLPLAFLAVSILVTVMVVLVPQLTGAEDPGDDAWIVVYIAMLTFPLAFGIAVLRYRLYDIDRLISRTVSYGLVTAALIGIYLGAVFVLGSLPPLDGELAVAGATLLAAALFNPLRRRIQQMVDRRFNRSRFDTERTLEALSRRLSNQVDLSALGVELEQVARQTMQPSNVSVWVRGAGG